MARIFTDGAEFGDMLFWNGGTSGTADVSSVVKRTGNYSYTSNSSGANSGEMVRLLDSAISAGYLRFGLNIAPGGGENTILKFRKGSTVIDSLRYDESVNLLKAYRGDAANLLGTSSIPLLDNTWHLIEIYLNIHDTTGVFDVKIDGTAAITAENVDTKPGADADFDNLSFLTPAGSFEFMYLDDLALNDTTGGSDNSWCNDGYVIAIDPDGNGDVSQLTNSNATSVDNYSYVDETPPDGDTSYVEGTTAGHQDLYTIADYSGTGKTIRRVFVESRAKSTGAVGDLMKLILKTGGTVYASSDISLGAAYTAVVGTDHTVNPATAVAWVEADIDALQIGEEVV